MRRLPDAKAAISGHYDLIVVGFGYAGAVCAIEAAGEGLEVLLVEKMPTPGGISVCSGGGCRIATNAASAFSYLRATCNGSTPDPVLAAFAEGMTQIEDRMRAFGEPFGVGLASIEYPGNYPFDGFLDLGFVQFAPTEKIDTRTLYPHVRGLRGGARHFKILQDTVAANSKITVRLATPAKRLVKDAGGRVCGAVLHSNGNDEVVVSRRGVVLACGGFENDDQMKQDFLQGRDILSAAYLGNTGDGIRMAQDAGCSLWHMWHYHGTYGLRHPDSAAYPLGIRLARLTDWVPSLPYPENMCMPWILVDQGGRRYMNEYPPYLHDIGHRPMELFDSTTMKFPRIPSSILFDEEGRKCGAIATPTYNDDSFSLDWSEDNLAEVESGILKRADSIQDLASQLNLELALSLQAKIQMASL